MLEFYKVDIDYMYYLRGYDPNLFLWYRTDIVCGPVLSVNGNDFYAQIIQTLNRRGYIVAVHSEILLKDMFPATKNVLTKIEDKKEYQVFRAIENKILIQAKYVYKHKKKPLCDYQFLESVYKNFNPS